MFRHMDLSFSERTYYRDRFRAARYAAFAQSEAFQHICFAIEEIGARLLGKVAAMGAYKPPVILFLTDNGVVASESVRDHIDALYGIVQSARNDAMHTGAYARHVAAKAVELCLLLEDALMAPIQRVCDHMVKEPVCIEPWHTVARARQLMLTHSFSNLPLRIVGKWHLLTEHGLARCLAKPGGGKKALLAKQITDACPELGLVDAPIVSEQAELHSLLTDGRWPIEGSPLWLVTDASNNLAGVISVSELL